MDFYFVAKRELNTCANSQGVIPWTAIRDYAAHYGLSAEETDDFTRIIRAMEEGMREAETKLKDEAPDDAKKK